MEVSIVIPVFNEVKVINSFFESLKRILDSIKIKYEIIAVNDGSKDGSGMVLDKIKFIKAIHHRRNKGYSAALKTGIKVSKYKWIIITDCDGTYPVDKIPDLLKYSQNYDMVVGARVGQKVSVPLVRRPAKWFLTHLASYIVGKRIPDLNSGLRIFKKDIALRFWSLFPEKFSFTSTITMACLSNNYDVKFIPINYYKRIGSSSMKASHFVDFINLITKLCLFFKPLKIFIPLGILMFSIAFSVFVYGYMVLEQVMDISVIIIVLSAIQIFIFGLLAELIVKTRSRSY